jgi:hypothetical protein
MEVTEMWILFRRFLVMTLTSWLLAKAAVRWPRLAGARRLIGTRRW